MLSIQTIRAPFVGARALATGAVCAALTLVPVAAGAAASPNTAVAGADDSIEALRRDLDARLAAQVAEVRPLVDQHLTAIVAAIAAGSPRTAAAARAELAELPPAAALVLVEELDQGNSPNDNQEERLQEAGRALLTVSSSAILGRLEELTEHAYDETRHEAIRALGGVPNAGGARRVLVDLHARRAGEDRAQALAALIQQGLDEGFDGLDAAVERRDQRALELGLRTATERDWDEAQFARLGAVLDAAIDESRVARDGWRPLVETLAAFEDLVEPQRPSGLLAHVIAGRVRGADGAALVEGVGALDVARRHVQDRLDTLTRSSDVQISQAALVALTRMGDKAAKSQLLDPLERDVDEATNTKATALLAIGRVKTRIAEYADAINDLRKAVKEAKGAGAYVQREIHVALAEAYLLNERLDKAASTLEDASLSETQRRELAALPKWRALAEHHRYGEVLEP